MNERFDATPESKASLVDRVDNRLNFLGWILFVLSSLAFIVASWESLWSLLGSLFFLLANLIFLVPYFRPASPNYIFGAGAIKS